MKKSIKLGVVASALMAVAGFAFAQAGTGYKPDPNADIKLVDPRESPYVTDARGVIVRDPFGLCWRTANWSVERAAAAKIEGAPFPNWTAGCSCDRDLMTAPTCEPPPAARAGRCADAAPTAAAAGSPAPTSEKVTFAADALFDFDKATLRPDGKAKLDDLVSKLAGVSLEVIIAVGYTDRLGGDGYNQSLSQKRAQGVKDYLVSKGIEPNRVYTEGKGKANPVKQCPDPSAKGEVKNRKGLIDCLQPNRRVEVEVVGTRPVRR